MGLLASRSPSSFPFVAGLGASLVLWLFARCVLEGAGGPAALGASLVRRAYVFGHELTHALAAWAVGAEVHAFHVGEHGGHVDLSRSSAFIALAPYCVPIYTLLVIAGYRVLVWLRPGAGSDGLFLGLLGLSLAFHVLLTFESLVDHDQPDLTAAGGVVFSLALIALVNGLLVLLLLKLLFPRAVALSEPLWLVMTRSAAFWSWAGRHARALAGRVLA